MEHGANYRKGKKTSFMVKYQANKHNGQDADFKAKLTNSQQRLPNEAGEQRGQY